MYKSDYLTNFLNIYIAQTKYANTKSNNNALYNFGFYKYEKFILKKQNIKKVYRDWIGKSLNIKSLSIDKLLKCTL